MFSTGFITGDAGNAEPWTENMSIGLAYLYSFILNGKGILIFRTDDPEKAEEVTKRNGLRYLVDEVLQKLNG